MTAAIHQTFGDILAAFNERAPTPKMHYPQGIVFELRRNASSWSRAKGDGARLFEKMLTDTADTIDRSHAANVILLAALQEAREFINDHVDVVDGDYGEPAPNRAMRLLPEIDAAIAKAQP